jgi:capsular polysaccharide biosynthesis protein
LLVMQNAGDADAYTLSKSNEYLGNLFAQMVYSGSFYDSVLSSQYNVDKNYFSGSYSDQSRNWKKMVETKTLSDTGIIEVNVYHPNPYQAQQISLAINDIMINKNNEYQGSGQLVKVRVIDQTLVSSYPVKPNLPQNIALALAGGLLFSLIYIYLCPEEKHDIKLWSGRKNKKNKNFTHSIKLDYYPEDNSVSNENMATENRALEGDINNILRN